MSVAPNTGGVVISPIDVLKKMMLSIRTPPGSNIALIT
jgi:hypothetical protein